MRHLGGTVLPRNSFFVDSTGRVGLRTAAPVLDLHITTDNTSGSRLEQKSSGGCVGALRERMRQHPVWGMLTILVGILRFDLGLR